MKISTKGRYALRLLIDLAQHNDSGFITPVSYTHLTLPTT